MEWLISGVLAMWAGLAIWQAPHGVLWKPAVAATAFGAWLVPLYVCIAGGLLTETGPRILTMAGALMLCTPWARALANQRGITRWVNEIWGPPHPSSKPPPPVSIDRVLTPHPVPQTPQTHLYAPARGLTLNLHSGRGPGPRPVIVLLHGGSWNSGDATQLRSTPTYLQDLGYSILAIHYRLAPEHPHPAQLDDIDRALEWARDNREEHNLDMGRVVFVGRSAGGHLALLSAYSRHPDIAGVAALYPPTDLEWSWEHPTPDHILDTPGTLTDFIGAPLSKAVDTYREASPWFAAHGDCPPTLLMHGSRDELVYPEQCRRMAARLAELGVTHQFIETPWDTHGFDANLKGPGGLIWTFALERFLAAVTQSQTVADVAVKD